MEARSNVIVPTPPSNSATPPENASPDAELKLSPTRRHRLAAFVNAEGVTRGTTYLQCSREALARLLSGLPVRRATLVLANQSIDALPPLPPDRIRASTAGADAERDAAEIRELARDVREKVKHWPAEHRETLEGLLARLPGWPRAEEP